VILPGLWRDLSERTERARNLLMRTVFSRFASINEFEHRVTSQNGEDGIIAEIFRRIRTTNRYFVEFGVQDGAECNTAQLALAGWSGLLIEGDPVLQARLATRYENNTTVKTVQEFITAENIASVFERNGVPASFDLLSIDIDGNDYWVWKAIAVRRPRAVVIEYNATMPPPVSRTIPYDPKFRFDETDYFGASLAALARLGREKGYTLVACDSRGINAFFVDDALAGRFAPPPIERLYRPFGPPHRVPPHAEGRPWAEV